MNARCMLTLLAIAPALAARLPQPGEVHFFEPRELRATATNDKLLPNPIPVLPPVLGPQTGFGTSVGGYTFLEDWINGTYYIRKGSLFDQGLPDANRPVSLNPNYKGNAVFYAYYDIVDKKIHMINYLTGEVKTIAVSEPARILYPFIESYLPVKAADLQAKTNTGSANPRMKRQIPIAGGGMGPNTGFSTHFVGYYEDSKKRRTRPRGHAP